MSGRTTLKTWPATLRMLWQEDQDVPDPVWQKYRDAPDPIRPAGPPTPVVLSRLWDRDRDLRAGAALLDGLGKNVLRKNGLPFTRRNAILYNTGGWTSAVSTILAVLLFTCAPQEFIRLPLSVRLAESASLAFIPALLFFVTRRRFPALAVSLRYNTFFCFFRVLLLLLINN